jgi:stage II sporulation protein AB (anti-sigma F factor)
MMTKTIQNRVNTIFLSRPENVALARVITASLAANWDITLTQLEDIKVAVSEGVSNAIIHGYENNPEKEVYFSIICYDDELFIEIKDNGVGIADINQAMQPSFSTQEERMGLGFSFMQSFMDEVIVVSAPGEGTTLTLKKKMPVTESR